MQAMTRYVGPEAGAARREARATSGTEADANGLGVRVGTLCR